LTNYTHKQVTQIVMQQHTLPMLKHAVLFTV